MPKKRPVGAFRGGYVSAEPYWGGGVVAVGAARQSVDSGGLAAMHSGI